MLEDFPGQGPELPAQALAYAEEYIPSFLGGRHEVGPWGELEELAFGLPKSFQAKALNFRPRLSPTPKSTSLASSAVATRSARGSLTSDLGA